MHRVLKPEGMAIVGSWHALQLTEVSKAIAKNFNAPYNPELDKMLSLSDPNLMTKVRNNKKAQFRNQLTL